MKYVNYFFCTFAAIWIPLKILAAILGIASLQGFISGLGEAPLYATLVGIILMLVDLWRSRKTQDEKIWWTTLDVILFPVVAPAYWFGFGLKNQVNRPDESPQAGPPDNAAN